MTPEEVMARYEAAASAHDLSAAIRLIDPEALHCGDRGTATGGSAGIDWVLRGPAQSRMVAIRRSEWVDDPVRRGGPPSRRLSGLR
jgi:hypothetical protein